MAAAVMAPVAIVALIGLNVSKDWVADVTVAPDPLAVPGLHDDSATPLTAEAALAQELRAADGADFREAVLGTFDHRVDYVVTADPEDSTVRFEVTADTADHAAIDAYSIANGFVAWGRTLDAARRRDEAQYELDHPPDGTTHDPTETAALQARIDRAQAALDQLASGGGSVVVAPRVPDDPAGPPLLAWLLGAVAVGVLLGLVVARAGGHRRGTVPGDPSPPTTEEGPHARAAGRGLRVALGVAVALLGAAVLAGYLSIWELRPASADLDEVKYACLERWVAAVPSGRTISVESEDRFFHDSVQEFSFPRLRLVDVGQPADVVLRVVPGDGPQSCGGYHIEHGS